MDSEPGTRDWGLRNRRWLADHRVRVCRVEARVPLVVLARRVAWRHRLVQSGCGRAEHGIEVQWTLTVVVVGAWLTAAAVARERVVRPLQTLSNLLAGAARGRLLGARRAAPTETTRSALPSLEINALGEHAPGAAARRAWRRRRCSAP